MDAELVEYELEPGPDPVRRPARGYPGSRSSTSSRVRARSDPLRLHRAPLRRHGRALPGPGAGAVRPLPDRHRVGQRGDRGRLHEGGRHRLPAQEQPGADRARHRRRARPGAGPHREGAGGGGAAALGGQPPRHLQQQPPGLRPDRPRRTIQALNSTAVEWSARLLGRRAARGRAGRRTSSPRRRRPFARRSPARPATSSAACRTPTAPSSGSRPPTPRWWTRKARVIGVCLNARDDQHPEAGRAGAAGERGALPRPLRQRERPGLRHRSRRRLPLREPRLAARRSAPRRRSSGRRRFLDVVHPDSRERYREIVRAGAGRRDAHPRRAGPGDRGGTPRSRSKGT